MADIQRNVLTWSPDDLKYYQGKVAVLVDIISDVSKDEN